MTYMQALATFYVLTSFLYMVHAYFRDRKNLSLYEESKSDRKKNLDAEKRYDEIAALLKGLGTFYYQGQHYKVVKNDLVNREEV